MSFYSLTKPERQKLVDEIRQHLKEAADKGNNEVFIKYFADEDTYIRKAAYLSIGRIYFAGPSLQKKLLSILKELFSHSDFKVRQTVINAAGEIGKKDFTPVQWFFR